MLTERGRIAPANSGHHATALNCYSELTRYPGARYSRCPCVCGVMAATQKEPPRARRRGGSASCFCTAAGMFYDQIRQRGLFLKSLLEEAALCLLAAKCRTVRSRAILV